MNLASAVAAARTKKGWSLRELERRSGISNVVISQIETGAIQDPGFSTISALARTLGLSMVALSKLAPKRRRR